jgi:hypothetical protein
LPVPEALRVSEQKKVELKRRTAAGEKFVVPTLENREEPP